MAIFLRKILIALGLSILIAGSSLLWYQNELRQNKNHEQEGRKEVATLSETAGSVEKRSTSRIVWNAAPENDQLYTHEAIRTQIDSSATIEFKGHTLVHLDPESVVVIDEEPSGQLLLDFQKGNIAIQSNAGGTKGVDETANSPTEKSLPMKLKSGQTEMEVADADLSLSQKSDDDSLDLHVDRGTVQMAVKGQTMQVDSTKMAKIGKAGATLSQEFFKIKEPRDQSTHFDPKVQFLWSQIQNDKKVFIELSTGKLIPVSGTSAIETMSDGKYVWRLKAIDTKDTKDVHTSAWQKLTVAKLLPPQPVSPIPNASVKPGHLVLTWSNPSKIKGLQIEIASDPQFQNHVLNDYTEDSGSFVWNAQKPGRYFWRLSAVRPDNNARIVSQVLGFEVGKPVTVSNVTVVRPQKGDELDSAELESGFFARWQGAEGKIKVTVRSPSSTEAAVFSQETTGSSLRLPRLKEGAYELALQTPTQTVTVPFKVKGILPAPAIEGLEGEPLKADQRGRALVRWSTVSGAKQYVLFLKDSQGALLRKEITFTPEANLKGLKPGSFMVSVQAVDTKGVPGRLASEKPMSVPQGSNVKPPKMKSVLIE